VALDELIIELGVTTVKNGYISKLIPTMTSIFVDIL